MKRTKITRATLGELEKTLQAFTVVEQNSFIGGGIGSKESPYTWNQFCNLSESELSNSCYYLDDNDKLRYYYGIAITVYGNSDSYYGSSNSGDNNDSLGYSNSQGFDFSNGCYSYDQFMSMTNNGMWRGGWVYMENVKIHIPENMPSGSIILNNALSYQGTPYLYGGMDIMV